MQNEDVNCAIIGDEISRITCLWNAIPKSPFVKLLINKFQVL